MKAPVLSGLCLVVLASATLAFRPAGSAGPTRASGTVAIQAGTIHLVENGRVVEHGTLLVRDGRVLAVGRAGVDFEVPPSARVVDYGADAVVVPGLVAANSNYGVGFPSERTAEPGLRAVDNFDPYGQYYLFDIAGGVTTAYLPPARGRLIAGQGAVVKLGGEDAGRRVLSASAAIHGSITAEAREVPGYWEPPVPATVDVGLGVAEPQLPRTTMGAIVALRELLALARGEVERDDYGPDAPRDLRELMQRGVPWRMGANTEQEVRALLRLKESERLPLVLDGVSSASGTVAEIAAAGASVVLEVDVAPQSAGRDFGKQRDDPWPVYDTAARLVAAGVPTAIATTDMVRPHDLRFAAAVASRGGLEPAAALRAITLTAAEILGVSSRVGSLTPGKDADFVVLNGPPLALTSSVLATWIDGELAWKVKGASAVVIEVDELHLGDGEVLRPGQVLIKDKKIAEVGQRVAHPTGAVVARGAAAMPGMIDALGFLGLEGSTRTPATDFKLARIVEPPDFADRRVAKSGVTTVVLTPRGQSASGVPMMAYKPAGADVESMVVSDPTALRLAWTDKNRLESGKSVREVLDKAVEYAKRWREYEEAIAKWVPPPPEAAKDEKKGEDEKADEKKEGEEKPKDAPKEGGEKKDEKKDEEESKGKKDKKKKDGEAETGDPVTGLWEAKVVVPPFASEEPLRVRLELAGEVVTGSLRCDSLSSTLVVLAGTFKEQEVDVRGLGSRGFVRVRGKTDEDKFEGQLSLGELELEVEATRTTKELERAARPEVRKEKPSEEKEPKGKPKAPGLDSKLEPLRRAILGQAAVVVDVDRSQEILECVAAFEKAGIKPVLYGADDAWRVADQLAGRVAGVILTQTVLFTERGKGLSDLRNRFADLADAGIPVAFHSAAEEGASELPLIAAYAVSQGLSPDDALRALTSDAAAMMRISGRVGRLAEGLDGDVLLLDGPPLEPSTSVLRTWVDGEEVR